MEEDFKYTGERFADIQLLRYRLNGFDRLSLRQKLYVYYLSKAALSGRDITTDQFGRYNLRIRKMLERVYRDYAGNRRDEQFRALEVYLKRLWFSNGIYHHYGYEKFQPGFSEEFLRSALGSVGNIAARECGYECLDDLCDDLFPVIFNSEILPKRVNQAAGEDLVQTSACNYYDGLTQKEVEDYYASMRNNDPEPPSYGLNSRLVKAGGRIEEQRWTAKGMYGEAIKQIVGWLRKAEEVAENSRQRRVISLLVDYYETGDVRTFDQYSIEWLKEVDGQVDFINGFIEVYGDPLGIKASWEGLVEYEDEEATGRARLISSNAQWFEDHSPVDPKWRKERVEGVSARVICAAMLGGDEYPSTAIGINLPNSEWIRARYGSKSITISNITDAYDRAARGNGFNEEFVTSADMRRKLELYGSICGELHTSLHECVGHGSGRVLPGVPPDALKAHGSTIEEARADLFALYFIADPKLYELGLVPSLDAFQTEYYSYMLNGLMTQLVRIKPGMQIEEAHMRNRSLIANWVYDHSEGAVALEKRDGKTCLFIYDYVALRQLFAELLAEVQRIKSEGDYAAACQLVERYGVKVDKRLHDEVLARYDKLGIAPYKGFLNPRMTLERDSAGNVCDVKIDYSETFEEQMLRYGSEYGFL